MDNKTRELIESEKSSEEVVGDLSNRVSESRLPPRTVQKINEFISPAEDLRVMAESDPDLNQIFADHLGSNWNSAMGDLLIELDRETR